jgi:hypothetical protein
MESVSILTKLVSRFGESAVAGAALGSAGGIIRAIYAKNVDVKARVLMLVGGALAGSVGFIAAVGVGWSEGLSVGVAVGVSLATRELSELFPRLVRNRGEELVTGLVDKATGVKLAPKRKAPAKKAPAKKVPAKKVAKRGGR